MQKKIEISDLIELIFSLADQYQPLMCIGLEKYSLEKVLQVNLQQEMIRRKKSLPIKEIPTDNRVSKEHRIKALEPRFQSGTIMIKREHQALIDQVIYYPQVRHDDVLDALKSQLAITFPGPVIEEKPDAKYASLSPRERAIWKHVGDLERRRVHRTKGEYL